MPTNMTVRSSEQLRSDALAIWRAGVDGVRSDVLLRRWLRVKDSTLLIADEPIRLASIGRIAVVGAGKAGAGMAAAVEEILGARWAEEKRLTGWINVPEDCVKPLARIRLHGARPAGVNEPTPAGVQGTEEILRLVESLSAADLCLCLISGGGSALLPAPVPPITLDDKLALTRHLSAAGANIRQLNVVRKRLSRIKGGGLARSCRAGRLAGLIISDVPGDPLDVIASGPTVEDSATAEEALAILEQFEARRAGISPRVFDYLQAAVGNNAGGSRSGRLRAGPARRVDNYVIGNNATAVDAAGVEAVARGYSPALHAATQCEPTAEEVGRRLADFAVLSRDGRLPNCLITGGEPVVKLVPPERRGRGGRNQQLVLAALERLADDGAEGMLVLSGGTDGEDGPTDAAGAWFDAEILKAARRQRLDPSDFLARNDAYRFFEPLGALMKTGPTHTNVCDVRVVLTDVGPVAKTSNPDK